MAIIRGGDSPTPGVLALAIHWGLETTCYVAGCDQPITTIISGGQNGMFCLCEEHFQQANVPGGTTLSIVFPGGNDEKARA